MTIPATVPFESLLGGGGAGVLVVACGAELLLVKVLGPLLLGFEVTGVEGVEGVSAPPTGRLEVVKIEELVDPAANIREFGTESRDRAKSIIT